MDRYTEQIAFWKTEGYTPQEALRSMGLIANRHSTWGYVEKAMRDEFMTQVERDYPAVVDGERIY